jgi:hypothetical protein
MTLICVVLKCSKPGKGDNKKGVWAFYLQRDLSAALNIRAAALCFIITAGRPRYLEESDDPTQD